MLWLLSRPIQLPIIDNKLEKKTEYFELLVGKCFMLGDTYWLDNDDVYEF